MAIIFPLSRRLPLTLGDIHDDEERVFICCLACGRTRDMLVFMLRKMVGPISFGTINGRFACRGKGGCGKSIGAVFPRSAPNPVAWARLYRPQSDDPGIKLDAPRSEFAFHIEEWQEKPDMRLQTLAQAGPYEMALAAFEQARVGRDLRHKPYVVMRHQGRVLKDSRRDLRIVRSDREPE